MHKVYKFIGILTINILLIVLLEITERYFQIPMARIKNDLYEDNYLLLFISLVLFAPLVEETAYRYQFIKGKFIYFTIIWSCLFGFINMDNPIITISTIIINVISFTIYFFLKKDKLPMFIIIIYTILFGVSHIINYEISEPENVLWYSYIFMFLPQIILGLCLIYIRINYLFRYSILYHSSYNFIIFLLHIFF